MYLHPALYGVDAIGPLPIRMMKSKCGVEAITKSKRGGTYFVMLWCNGRQTWHRKQAIPDRDLMQEHGANVSN